MGLQQTLKALADPIRREILNMLKKRRMSAGEITEHFSVTAPSISRHLSVLKDADLIRDTREGKFIFYEINTSVLEETMLWIAALKGDNDNAKKALSCIEQLQYCEAHSSVILSETDIDTLKRLGIRLTSEDKFQFNRIYQK